MTPKKPRRGRAWWAVMHPDEDVPPVLWNNRWIALTTLRPGDRLARVQELPARRGGGGKK